MQKWLKILLVIVAVLVIFFVVLPVVIVMIAALVFTINPTQVGTNGCTGFQKLPIGNFQTTSNGLQVQITNQTGRNLDDVHIKASFDDGGFIDSKQYNGDDELVVNASTTVSWTGQNLTSGSHVIDLEISYNDGDYTRTATASCRGTVG